MIKEIKSPLFWAFFLLFPILINAFQIQGVWITRWELNSPDNIKKTVEKLEKANVKDAFVQIYGSGYAFFNSNIAPRKYMDFDPLAEFTKYAKKSDIRVHAWINLLYMWDRKELTEDNDHILNRYPESAMVDDKGNSLLDYSLEKIRMRNIEGIYVSPASKVISDYIYMLIEEIIKNYPIDGIHLDYCRFPGSEFVHDKFMRTEFQKIYTVEPHNINSKKSQLIFENVESLNKIWKIFPKHILNNLIKKIYNNSKTINPNVQVSAAVISNISRSERDFYQFWWEWIKDDYMDFIIIMAYSSDLEVLRNQLASIKTKVSFDKIVIGLGTYNQSLNNVRNNFQILAINPVMGFCLFSSTSIAKHQNGFEYVGDNIFKKYD